MMRSIEHEKAMIKTFVVRDMQKEFLSFLTRPEDRWKFTRELATFPWFEMRFAKPVQWRVNPSLSEFGQTLSGISNVSFMLRSKGAGEYLLGDFRQSADRCPRNRADRRDRVRD